MIIFVFAQKWFRHIGPRVWAVFFRLFYCSNNIVIGNNFRCDSLPRCLIDSTAKLTIGNEVEFRSGVELRVHGHGHIIIEDGVRIDRGVRILATNSSIIRIQDGARIGLYSVLNGGDSIDVGKNCLVSGFVFLQTSMHQFRNHDIPIKHQGYEHGPINIGEGAWLGAHVVVMPSINIGHNAVIGSNAVVTHDIPSSIVAVGIPARPLKNL